jgi:hypothetical protein
MSNGRQISGPVGEGGRERGPRHAPDNTVEGSPILSRPEVTVPQGRLKLRCSRGTGSPSFYARLSHLAGVPP